MTINSFKNIKLFIIYSPELHFGLLPFSRLGDATTDKGLNTLF